MTTMITELYDALKQAGVDDETAKKAAQAVLGIEDRQQLATKADLANLKSDLIQWNVGAMAILTAIFAAIVKLA